MKSFQQPCSLSFSGSEQRTMAGNQTTFTIFILAVLSEKPELQLHLFLHFLGICVVTVIGDLGILMLIFFSSTLHTLNVLFPHQSVLHRPLPFHCRYPQNAGELCDREEHHLLHCYLTQLYFFRMFTVLECYMLVQWPMSAMLPHLVFAL
jgi:olfactory receptor